MQELKHLGSFAGLQIVPTLDDSDLVSRPVDFVAGAHRLTYHGGRTITNPKLALMICGTDPYDQAKLDAFGKDLMESGYLAAGSYWGFQTGKYLGSFGGPVIQPGTVLDSQLRAGLESVLQSYPNLPQPDDNTIYALILPAGVSVQFDGSADASCASFCGFHESDPSKHLLYTVQPDTDCAGCNQGDPFVAQTMVLAHEVAETCSDPDGTGWYEDSTGMENGDVVAWIQQPYGPWTVQGFADPAGNNVMGAYQPASNPQPGGSGARSQALALAQPVVDRYQAIVTRAPHSTRGRYGLEGSKAVLTALQGLSD